MTTESKEVIAIATKILDLIHEHISCSDEVLIAALKVVAMTTEETKAANFRAVMMADMLRRGFR